MKPIRPTIDHSLLSPNGRMSRRARNAAIKREGEKLFPPGYFDAPPLTEEEVVRKKVNGLREHAKLLRDLAERGMQRRKYTKIANQLEAEALSIEAGLPKI